MIHLYSFVAFWLSSKINELPPFRDTSLLSKDTLAEIASGTRTAEQSTQKAQAAFDALNQQL